MPEVQPINARDIRFYFEHGIIGDPIECRRAVRDALAPVCAEGDRASWFPEVVGGGELSNGTMVKEWINEFVFMKNNGPTGAIKLAVDDVIPQSETYCIIQSGPPGSPANHEIVLCYHTFRLQVALESGGTRPFTVTVKDMQMQSQEVPIKGTLAIIMPVDTTLTIAPVTTKLTLTRF